MKDTHTVDLADIMKPVHEEVARGISAFSTMEAQLAFLFGHTMKPGSWELALIAFDAIQLTSPKIRVLKAVAARKYDQDWNERLSRTLKRVSARADFRAKLAHWTVSVCGPDGAPITSAKDPIEARLIPPWFSTRNLDMHPEETVDIEEIKAFSAKCHDVGSQLIELGMEIQSKD